MLGVDFTSSRTHTHTYKYTHSHEQELGKCIEINCVYKTSYFLSRLLIVGVNLERI